MPLRQPRRAGLLLATGQITSYNSEADDGFYESGLQKSYTVLTTGAYSGTTNIDLTHYSGTDIAFVNGTPDTITSTVLDFTTLFVAADVIVTSGAAQGANNAAHTIAGGGVAANTLTLESNTTLVNEAAGPTIVIAKREAKNNNCVLDDNTGLMWSRYVSGADMGPASDGKMPWTGQLYDIFQYCAACNAASLAGYTDWRVVNTYEMRSIYNLEVANAYPDNVAFATWGTYDPWSSTTVPNVITAAFGHYSPAGRAFPVVKTENHEVCLIRGGI